MATLTFPHTILHAVDFIWGYSKTSSDCESLDSWAAANNLELLHNPKGAANFSHRWNVGTKPVLAFASVGHGSRLPDRRVLEKILRSQHGPSLVTLPTLKIPSYSDPVKRWNFHKADWNRFCFVTGESAEKLPPLDTNTKKTRCLCPTPVGNLPTLTGIQRA